MACTLTNTLSKKFFLVHHFYSHFTISITISYKKNETLSSYFEKTGNYVTSVMYVSTKHHINSYKMQNYKNIESSLSNSINSVCRTTTNFESRKWYTKKDDNDVQQTTKTFVSFKWMSVFVYENWRSICVRHHPWYFAHFFKYIKVECCDNVYSLVVTKVKIYCEYFW